MIYEAEVDQLQKPLTEILDRRFTLIRSEKQNGIMTIRVQINGHSTTNDLIEALLPAAQVLSFKELTPSMNDIFIKKVTGKFPLEK